MQEITQLLDAIRTGVPGAGENLLPLVYRELRRLAAHKLANDRNAHTIQATMLVHDAWLRLSSDSGAVFESRAHFFGAAAEAMRRILVESAERRSAAKRGGGVEHVAIDGLEIEAPAGTDDELIAVNESLDRLAKVHPQKAELVKLRYFAGISIEETAALLGISIATANRHWAYARAWLHQDISRRRSGEL